MESLAEEVLTWIGIGLIILLVLRIF